MEISIGDIAEAGVLSELRISPEIASVTCTIEDADVSRRGVGLVRLVASGVLWLQYASDLPPIINSQNGCDYVMEVDSSPIVDMVEQSGRFAVLRHPLKEAVVHPRRGHNEEDLTGELVHVRIGSFIAFEFVCPRSRLKLTFEPRATATES